MGRHLEWNWLALAGAVFLFPFTFGLYFIPESPPWLVYNDEEDLAFKSVVLVRGEEYDATIEIRKIKESLARHKNDLHALLLDERMERYVLLFYILIFVMPYFTNYITACLGTIIF